MTAAMIETLSDEELQTELFERATPSYPRRDSNSLYLLELAKRHRVEPLRKFFEERKKGNDTFTDTADALTALRRAEGKPAPVHIRVEIEDKDWRGRMRDHFVLRTYVENVDPEETVNMLFGCDDRSGRRERWRVELTSPDGKRVPDAWFMNVTGMGGGIGSAGPMPPGTAHDSPHHLDPRSYVSPPPSGRYKLQVFHANPNIADEPDTTGLIVWKSDPIDILVTNPPPQRPFSALALTVVLALGTLTMFTFSGPRLPLRRRDLIVLAFAMTIAIAWAYDQRVMCQSISRSTLHQDAVWTWRPVEKGS